jgi:2-dehydro-3-deoxygluconokinase
MPIKVVTLGEIMLRLSPPGFERIVQAGSFDITYGGGEANVAAALCNYGLQGTFVSKVPENSLGQSAINHLRRYGVDTQFVARGGNRLGIYFLENGASMRPSQVIYDRSGSSFSEAKTDDFDFDKLFDEAVWFHTCGITPSLSDNAAKLTEAALKTARKKGITTSLDINYRKKLWSKQKAFAVLSNLWQYTDVCFGIEEFATNNLRIQKTTDGLVREEINMEAYNDMFEQMKNKFGFNCLASTIRKSYSASDNGLSALVFDGSALYKTKEYDIRIVDRVGSGDAFVSGLIYGMITGMKINDAAEFGIAASALKHTFPGDMNHATLAEVTALMNGDTSGRVQR